MRIFHTIAIWAIVLSAQGWAAEESTGRSVVAPQSFAYVLQADAAWKSRPRAVAALAECGRDWIVVDAAYTSEHDGRWRPEDLSTMRAGKPGRKVIAYLSIGEAEDYRAYWKKEWDADRDGRPDAGAPKFLLAENPDWEGNYRVRYWHDEWQTLMLDEIDRIAKQGFDGLYLDIVDAFETFEFDGRDWQDNRPNPETGRSYRQDMIAWVSRIGERLRLGNPQRILVAQNASQLVVDQAYRTVIDGVGLEDLFTNGNRRQKPAEIRSRLDDVALLINDRKPVLVIEYPKNVELQDEAIQKACEAKMVWLVTDRNLKTLGRSGE